MKTNHAVFLCCFLIFAAPTNSAEPEPANTIEFENRSRIALVGNSLGERFNLFGHFETQFHLQTAGKRIQFRNFCWPADEVGVRQRPSNYTKIDDPLKVYGPDLYLCFFGTNESYGETSAEALEGFKKQYQELLEQLTDASDPARGAPRFILVGPAALESTGHALHPDATDRNRSLVQYRDAVKTLAEDLGIPFIDVFDATRQAFDQEEGNQYTINGIHLNEAGDRLLASLLMSQLFGDATSEMAEDAYERVRATVNDKSWLHLQDYRMLNGWYVYGGRRTWDTETFPSEYQKIRNMVAVRDRYLWDLAEGKPVPTQPDDSQTGSVVVPETMFGTRDDNFRKMREPAELVYPSPEESIKTMSVPDGMEVQLFASEREFPELANPNQIAFDARGRLWVSCMPNYPQWQPGNPRPNDRLLIFEDTDGDGKADSCKTFYDKLICPTGFEFFDDGVLVVDEPRIIFLKDTDGDDKADQVVHLFDGIATDDTHHTMGAWEFSHGGYLHMLEGVALSTTLETPWGPFRNKGTGGAYVLDPISLSVSHYRTPGYGNPWCLVFDRWGNGIVGDGTNAKQHWISPLFGKEVNTRKTLRPVFDNQGMRPAVGNEFLLSRHLPNDMQGQFIYACVINMHGLPRFELAPQTEEAGYEGQRIANLLDSTDMTFRPVDPKIGPDGAVWFGDWCNALIGHMQYSQRDPNRDHAHGRIYRLVNTRKPLLPVVDLTKLSEGELLDLLLVHELRTRYRVRRELRVRDEAVVMSTINDWIKDSSDSERLCEAMWIQESFRRLDPSLIGQLMKSENYLTRAAAVHSVTNELQRFGGADKLLAQAANDPHPRVRLEAIRGASFLDSADSTELALSATNHPMDYWLEYTLEHTLHALKPQWSAGQEDPNFLASSTDRARQYLQRHIRITGPGGAAVVPLELADDVEADENERRSAISQLASLRGGNSKRGEAVYKQVCSACHQVGELGKAFGPNLSDIGMRMKKSKIIESIVMPNAEISKGYETVNVLTIDGDVYNGFVLESTDDTLSLGIANGKRVDIPVDDIEVEKPMKASSMPEGLAKQIAPIEFLDLIEFLSVQRDVRKMSMNGWTWTEYRKPPKLRKLGDAVELSSDAAIRLGNHFPNSNWNSDPHLLLTSMGREGFDFAFHSNHDADSPFVTIRLSNPAEIQHLVLRNRLSRQFHERAEGLTVSVSDNGKDFQKVWSADKMVGEWKIDFPEGTRGRFLRIGLEGKGTFHLYQATVYGRASDN